MQILRVQLLEKGYTGRFRVPGDNASPHQKFFKESPQAVCKCEGGAVSALYLRLLWRWQ